MPRIHDVVGEPAPPTAPGAQAKAGPLRSIWDALRRLSGHEQQTDALSPRQGTADATSGSAKAGATAKPAEAPKLEMTQVVAAVRGATAAEAGVSGPAVAVFDRAVAIGAAMREAVRSSPGAERYVQQTAFMVDILPDSAAAQLITGVPCSISMGQAAQETGYGKSVSPGNNFFGIKGTGPAGSTRENTWEEVGGKRVETTATFRAYDDRYQSFVDHGRLLSENPTYAEAMKHTEDPNRMIEEVHGAGYATDSKYASNIQWIMRTFNLTAIDPLARQLKDLSSI